VNDPEDLAGRENGMGGTDMLSSPEIPSNPNHDDVSTTGGVEVRLRSYHARDRRDVLRLYHHGRLMGVPDLQDAASDLDQIEDVYLKRPQDHFWVAELNDQIIGSIAIKEDETRIAHVRRLRVDAAWKTWNDGEIARVLIRKATHHARQHDCLKIVLHTPVDDQRAIAFLHEVGFEFARTREVGGRHLLEFYVNLYVRVDGPIPGREDLAKGLARSYDR
jgi:ribosomal protein S18 acetylase RimI-like enzyme